MGMAQQCPAKVVCLITVSFNGDCFPAVVGIFCKAVAKLYMTIEKSGS